MRTQTFSTIALLAAVAHGSKKEPGVVKMEVQTDTDFYWDDARGRYQTRPADTMSRDSYYTPSPEPLGFRVEPYMNIGRVESAMIDRTFLRMNLDVREALVECDTQRAIADDGIASARADTATARAQLSTLEQDNNYKESYEIPIQQDYNAKLASIMDNIEQGPWKAVQYNLERGNMLDTIPLIIEDEWTTSTQITFSEETERPMPDLMLADNGYLVGRYLHPFASGETCEEIKTLFGEPWYWCGNPQSDCDELSVLRTQEQDTVQNTKTIVNYARINCSWQRNASFQQELTYQYSNGDDSQGNLISYESIMLLGREAEVGGVRNTQLFHTVTSTVTYTPSAGVIFNTHNERSGETKEQVCGPEDISTCGDISVSYSQDSINRWDSVDRQVYT